MCLRTKINPLLKHKYSLEMEHFLNFLRSGTSDCYTMNGIMQSTTLASIAAVMVSKLSADNT